MAAPGIMGPTPERLALAKRAADLRAQGLLQREIQAELGISRSYASELLRDPDGSLARARKDSYAGVCVGCGGPTSGNDGPNRPPERCASCSWEHQHAQKFWTRERIIEAIRRWAAEHDGRPPRATDWQYRDLRGDGYPPATSVYNDTHAPFNSWGEAIEAAGFPRPERGHYDRGGERGLHDLQRSLLAWLRQQDGPATIYEFIREYPRTLAHPANTVGSAARRLVGRGLVKVAHRERGPGGKVYYEAVR